MASLKQELAQDLYNVAGTIAHNEDMEFSAEVENFLYSFFDLDDRRGEETDYEIEEIIELIGEVEPYFDKANGLYEKSSKERLVKAIENDFENLDEIYEEKIRTGLTTDELMNAFAMVSQKFGGDER